MCGIFGFYSRDGAGLDARSLQDMSRVIRHRGPDDEGLFAVPHAAVGNRRLSIIDITGGRQPFVSDDGQVAVVQNGEIFNYVELAAELAKQGVSFRTRSDTEVILRLYEREGIDFLRRLNGMFAIAVLDLRREALFLARDRLGVKPLFIGEHGERVLFASEIKSLLAAGLAPQLDPVALDQLLTFNYVPLPRTIFTGVRHVAPGHYVKLDRDGSVETRWWDLAAVAPEPARREEDWAEEMLAILDDAVRIRMRSDAPFGAFLSGGVDSSTVVGMMARHLDRPVRTFCIGFEDPRYDESPFALDAARRFNTQHTSATVDPQMFDLWPTVAWHCDQPHGDASFMPTYRVAELAARDVKVVLTGDGGDELFAGYDKYRTFFGAGGAADANDREFRSRYREVLTVFDPHAKARLYGRTLTQELKDADPVAEVLEPLFARAGHFDRLGQALYIDTMQLLPGNNLVKPDRMGMAVSLEARTPFLDYRLAELAFRMPGHLKLRDGETKYLYKRAVTPLIGRELAYRRKQMFTVPIGDWLRTELYAECRRLLLDESQLVAELFRRDELERMIEAHRAGTENLTRELRLLCSLEIWGRAFLG